jgi:hypothetical protein
MQLEPTEESEIKFIIVVTWEARQLDVPTSRSNCLSSSWLYVLKNTGAFLMQRLNASRASRRSSSISIITSRNYNAKLPFSFSPRDCPDIVNNIFHQHHLSHRSGVQSEEIKREMIRRGEFSLSLFDLQICMKDDSACATSLSRNFILTLPHKGRSEAKKKTFQQHKRSQNRAIKTR